MRRAVALFVLVALGPARVWAAAAAPAAETELPNAQPIPDLVVLPLPLDQASFQYRDRELTRYYFGPTQQRPFWYPIAGPQGRTLTRMGHPHDAFSHSHHNSVWVAHKDVGGVSFWEDRGKNVGRIVQQRVDQYVDGPQRASMLTFNHWLDPEGKPVLHERRRATVEPLDGDAWRMLIDMEWICPGKEPVTIGVTPFGPMAVRMAKSIGINDGGGRLLNSEGQLGEVAMFRKPARWVDYSGPVTKELRGGITLMDHPENPSHPSLFHVRSDGWMGCCLTLERPLVIAPEKPLRLRYALWVHDGVPSREVVEPQWKAFAQSECPPLAPVKRQ